MANDNIHLYRPRQTPPEILEAIFVGRESLLQEIIERLDRRQTGASRQHYLIIGPRGIGKTNLLTLIEYRIRQNPGLGQRWKVISPSEEVHGITKVADLLIEALRILFEQTGDENAKNVYSQVKHDDNDARVTDLSLDAFRKYHSSHGFGVLLMLENVNRVFEKQIKHKREMHLLRKILIEEDWLTMVCTSPTFLNSITKPEEPLFEFFQTHLLSELTMDEQYLMLQKIASLTQNTEFEKSLKMFQSRLRALYHFTGGNPRPTIMLYNLVANHSITDVATELDYLLDQLTPFYQDRMNEISTQEGKVLETMALMAEGCTPTELARDARMEAKLVRAVLTRLEKSGYVRREERRRKRTVYIMPERFFRIWHQMNHSRAAKGRIQYLLEFFSSWYATKEERDHVWNELMDKFNQGLHEEENDSEDLAEYMKYIAAVSEGSEKFEREFDLIRQNARSSGIDSVVKKLEALDNEYKTNGDYFFHKGYFLANDLGQHELAISAFRRARELKQDDIIILSNLAITYNKCGRYIKADESFNEIKSLIFKSSECKTIGDEKEMLLKILREEENPIIVQATAYLIGRIFHKNNIDKDIIVILKSTDCSWRCQHCATVLGLMKSQESVEVLFECLSNQANNVRGSAATALGRIGLEKAVEPLIQLLNDEDRIIRGSVARA